jgi:hypothetical protein
LSGVNIPFVDIALARRLERAEGTGNRRFVEEHARFAPEDGACWIEVAGAYAMFDGPSSPVTQTFGLGMFQPPTPADFAALEAFFHNRGAPADHEVSPLADPATLSLLNERGYRPIELTSVMFRPVAADTADASKRGEVTVRKIDASDAEVWAQTAAAGWVESGVGDFMLTVARVNVAAPDGHLFLAEYEGRPIATAVLAVHEARLHYAASVGCDLALMGAAPGSGSQRNAERHGFRIAYTRIKWRRAI